MDPHFRDLKYQKERLESALVGLPDEDQIRIHEALIFAEDAHQEHQRSEGDPYIIHPIRSTLNLIEGLQITDPDIIITTLLHDVVEDNATITFADIEERFGATVRQLCEETTQDKEKETTADYIYRILKASPADIAIKAAEKLDNVRSIPLMSHRGERYKKYVTDVQELFIPLANATGNVWMITEMQAAYDAIPDKS